jgi:hypothetical protein
MPAGRAKIRSFLLWLAILASVSLLAATFIFLIAESRWAPQEAPRSPPQAFVSGAIGTELIPLPVLEVLPELFPDKFPKPSTTDRGWVRKYGFIPPGWEHRLLKNQQQEDFRSPENGQLPLGFSVARLRPLSAFPSPVSFVGLSCAACHSVQIRTDDTDPGVVVFGPGNSSLDLIAFFENFKAALVQLETTSVPSRAPEYVLSLKSVVAKEAELGKRLETLEQLAIRAWIAKAREVVIANFANSDEPRVNGDLHNSRQNRAGPLRSNPFRNLIQTVLSRPGLSADRYDLNMGFVKFAAVFEQGDKEWAQFDGTVRKIYSRSAFAAVAAGATVVNLSEPEIIHNITASTDYVKTLEGPRWEMLFPAAPIDRAKAARGLAVYREHCSSCHGYRDLENDRWLAEDGPGKSNRLGEIVGPAEVKTDPERLNFAHQADLPQALHDYFGNLPRGLAEGFPQGHPFALAYDNKTPSRSDIRSATGYLNSTLPGAFLRAPFLHNASVMTLRELINLDPRRNRFYRGANYYDFAAVGLASPPAPEPDCQWEYDTSLRGNSNQGHDYPWTYSDHLTADRRQQLESLLEYLKTL